VKIGLCNGCWDLYHEGHRYFLQEARKHCNYLVVAVNSDESVSALKGDSRPVWNLERRIRVITSNPSVSAVIPFNGDAFSLIEIIRPDVVIRGGDQLDAATHPGLLYITIPRLPNISTTEIMRRQS
jgi:D-beta-D-heptose 7-phosphate kinase/D-beta-D-heptose 1-phosphate adenosyltransferase